MRWQLSQWIAWVRVSEVTFEWHPKGNIHLSYLFFRSNPFWRFFGFVPGFKLASLGGNRVILESEIKRSVWLAWGWRVKSGTNLNWKQTYFFVNNFFLCRKVDGKTGREGKEGIERRVTYLTGLAKMIFPMGVNRLSLEFTLWYQVLKISQRTTGGASVFKLPSLQWVPETRNPPFKRADLAAK